MRIKCLLLGIVCLFQFVVHATSTRTAEDILGQKEVKNYQYIFASSTSIKAVVLDMSFGDKKFEISTKDREILKKATVFQVDLVFTDFPKGEDLKQLNLTRIKALESIQRSLVSDSRIRWRIYRQMACKSESEAKTFFHGLVIHYKPYQGKEAIGAELKGYDRLLPPDSLIKDPELLRKRLPDSTIFKVLERKKEWKNMTVVADLTGSMFPYTSQLTLWFKLKLKDSRVNDVVFFNDGDMKTTSEKVIGETGGIYFGKATDYETVRKLAIETVSHGGGGDGPENDIEALIKAEEKTDKENEMILIADNWAPIKDFVLMKELTRPVHIILCGAYRGINIEYLELALRTGGSVHTMEEDLEDLIDLNEGETFEFMRKKYTILGGRIVPVTGT